jgi:hypothetical protein
MYFSTYDKQNGRYFNTGRNSLSYQECLEKIWHYNMGDLINKPKKLSKEEVLKILPILRMMMIEIHQHDEEIEEE